MSVCENLGQLSESQNLVLAEEGVGVGVDSEEVDGSGWSG